MPELATTTLFSDANLLAYYKLEDVNDSKGSNTLTNNNTVSFNAAKFNNGADLGSSNTNKYLSQAGALGLNGAGAFAFTFWVKLQAEIGSGTYHFFEFGNVAGTVILRVRYEYNGGTRRLAFSRGKPAVADDASLYTVTLGTSIFHHIVMTYDTTNVNAYVDGSVVATDARSGVGAGGSTGFTIGEALDTSNPASAIIDDFAVFNRNLTQTDVTALFSGVPPSAISQKYSFFM